MSLKLIVLCLFGLAMAASPDVKPCIDLCKKCVYNGNTYQNGDTIKKICIDITCVNGIWKTTETYDKRCGFCSLSDDPHFVTFDRQIYDWHGTCNYSISQLNFGFRENFGIYSQFQQCGMASCVHITTFTDNPQTVIEVKHGTPGTVSVNGNPYSVPVSIRGISSPNQPVLAWRSNGCSMFLGSQGLLLKACSNQIFVWAHRTLRNKLNGLCGHYNFWQKDDFTDRTGDVLRLHQRPFAFPLSWMTNEQSKAECKHCGIREPCKSEKIRMEMLKVCRDFLSLVQWKKIRPSAAILKQAIWNCATDLCNLRESNTKPAEIEKWKKKMIEMLINNIMIEANTKISDPCEIDSACTALLAEDQINQTLPSEDILKQAISNCEIDLCNLRENNAGEEEIEKWMKDMQELMIDNIMTEPTAEGDFVTPVKVMPTNDALKVDNTTPPPT